MSEANGHDQVPWDYDEIVFDAAHLVYDGVIGLSEVSVPQRVREADVEEDFDGEQLRQDVSEELTNVEKQDPTTKTNETALPAEGSSDVDWDGLWDEFGFATPDSVDFRGASHTQLRLAIDCTKQGVNAAPRVAIQAAIESGEIVPVEVPGKDGHDVTRGYCRPGSGA